MAVSFKCTLGSETRLVHSTANGTYAELLAGAKEAFPGAKPFVMKYLDGRGDLVTITSRKDLGIALTQAVVAHQSSLHGKHAPNLLSQAIPPIKVECVPVDSAVSVWALQTSTTVQ